MPQFPPVIPTLAEESLVIARSRWRKGLGTAVAKAVARYAFAELGLFEIQAEVLQRNLASIRLLEKTGFVTTRLLPATDTEPETLAQYVLTRGGVV
jgi:RimJ/RimL family protein N-acetyltransferase